MNPTLHSLMNFVASARFLAHSGEISELLPDDLLAELESEPFESNWLRIYHAIEALRITAAPSPPDAVAIEAIGKQGYLRTYALTNSPDLSGCVCDDLELIASALLFNIEDPWLNGLWSAYRSGGLPRGSVQPVPGHLKDLL